MKFDVVVGNPPYQGDGKQQIYTGFYVSSIDIADNVCLIFPTGWQDPKSRNGLQKMNTKEIKQDKQIVHIDNVNGVFQGVAGAELTNIVLWKKGYDNGLDGRQLVLDNGRDGEIKRLPIEKSDIEKPLYIRKLHEYVSSAEGFMTLSDEVSARKPYGLGTDILKHWEKYDLPPLRDVREEPTDIRVFTPKGLRYVPHNYPFPKTGSSFDSYKVFITRAWGNMSEHNGLGGAYADIFIGQPKDACIESYLESGNFTTEDDARKYAKYLMTKFARGLLYVNKYTHDTMRKEYSAVPKQDFSEDWWDLSIEEINEKLFDKYDIPQDVRKQVNANIQKKDESNIITL